MSFSRPPRFPTRRFLAILAILGSLTVPLGAHADVIELTNGERIVGKVKDATPTGVVIQVRGKDVRIPQARVRSIAFEAEPAPGPAARPQGRPLALATARPPAERPVPAHVAAALSALAGLQDATVNALPAGDYTARVEETRRQVEHALAEGPDDAHVRTAIAAALHYHAFAAYAEGVYEARGDLGAIQHDAVVAQCIPLSERVTHDAEQLKLNPQDPTVVGLLSATEGATPLRACAAQKMAEAESFARTPR